LIWVSSASLVPCPPARIATFMAEPFSVGDATSTPHRLIGGQPIWRLKFGFNHDELGRKVPRYFCGCSSLNPDSPDEMALGQLRAPISRSKINLLRWIK
jgi:hypothetical protein